VCVCVCVSPALLDYCNWEQTALPEWVKAR